MSEEELQDALDDAKTDLTNAHQQIDELVEEADEAKLQIVALRIALENIEEIVRGAL